GAVTEWLFIAGSLGVRSGDASDKPFSVRFAFQGDYECYRDLYEAAGAADAAACSTSNRWVLLTLR
ncbi:MAG TPA: hypothetical protein VKB49_21510, partial [Candidatus Sulfotelmatobacter sp.]|nr:hypothetical protein [Candidatus Sulfotelmatobacter sp.]